MIPVGFLKRQQAAIKERQASLRRQALTAGRPSPNDQRYQTDPCGYCRDILGVTLTDVQQHILSLLLVPPYRVLVKSGHNVGKSFIAACATSWFYDTYPRSVVLTVAPTREHVVDVLWTELRLLRAAAPGGYLGGFTGPKAPMMFAGPEHWAKGLANDSGEAFAGRHRDNMGVVFDEAVGIDPIKWRVATTMFRPQEGNFFLAIFNPTDPGSMAYFEEQQREGSPPDDRPKWHVVSMSSLDHPNVVAHLANPDLPDRELPVPNAVTKAQIDGWIADMAERRQPGEDLEATDVEWPPGSGIWYRPGPDFECRALGRWPSGDAWGVWSDRLWQVAETAPEKRRPALPVWKPSWSLPVIGCDVAQRGFNYTAIHSRQDGTSLGHERHHGWDSVRTAGRLVQLCHEWSAWYNEMLPRSAKKVSAKDIPVNVDGSGDFGVLSMGHAQGYSWRGVVAQERAVLSDRYDTVRSELWFRTVEKARRGVLDLSRLSAADRQRLHGQVIAVQWTLTAAGCRKVESKDDIRRPTRMGSDFLIDEADALNLAYWDTTATTPTVQSLPRKGIEPRPGGAAYRRGMLGLEEG